MPASGLCLFVKVVILCCGLTGGANSQVTLKFKSAGGSVLTNAVEENTAVAIECSYTLDSTNTSPKITIISFDTTGLPASEVGACVVYPPLTFMVL